MIHIPWEHDLQLDDNEGPAIVLFWKMVDPIEL